jgi:hypothetical protein
LEPRLCSPQFILTFSGRERFDLSGGLELIKIYESFLDGT